MSGGPSPWRARAVLFDFSGTLFAGPSDAALIRGAAAATGLRLGDGEVARLVQRLEAARADPRVVACQPGHDRSAAAHRQAVMMWLAAAALRPELTDAVYERLCAADTWSPYPDTPQVLGSLRRRGVPVGVVSNIGWDIRRNFARHGLLEAVGAFTLSFEHGTEKPDPSLFGAACRALAVEPARALMVGDSPAHDGGAVSLGMPVYLLPSGASAAAPRGLDAVLRLV